eukprot:6602861-Prymnesium_polylepis.1
MFTCAPSHVVAERQVAAVSRGRRHHVAAARERGATLPVHLCSARGAARHNGCGARAQGRAALTTHPARRASIPGRTARVIHVVDSTLSEIRPSTSESVSSWNHCANSYEMP